MLRREQLNNRSARPNQQGMKAGHCRNQKKKKHQDQYDKEPFTRAIIDITSTPPHRRRHGSMPVGYSGEAALRREHCNMTPESRNSAARSDGHC
jgi:hypothetical protein